MKLILLTFLVLLFSLSLIYAQEDEREEPSFINPGYVEFTQQSIFDDGQPVFSSNWEWMHPRPSGSTMNWVQVIDADNWVMAGLGGTFQKTTDGGATWTVVKEIGGLSSTGFYRSIYDGHFFDAMTGLLCGSSGTLVRTTDGGATWDSVGVGSTGSIYSMYFLTSTVGFITGSTSIDVWKTTDAGLTWTALSGGILGTAYEIYAIDEDTLFYGSTTGDLGRSNDGGATWTEVDIGISETIREIEFSSPTEGWAVGDDGAASYTTDAGLTWTLANTGLPVTSDFNDVDIMSTMTYKLNESFTDETFPPTGWHIKNVLGATYTWERWTSTNNTPPACARIRWDAAGGEDWLVTPQLSISSGDSLKFWARKLFTTVYEPDTLEIRISTTDTSIASFTDVIFKSSVNVAFETFFEKFAFDLSAYDGMSIYIAFKRYDVDGNGVYLDDITVGEPVSSQLVYITGDPFAIYSTTDMGTTWTPFSHLDPSQAWTGEFFTTDWITSTDAITVGTRGMVNRWPSTAVDAGTAYNTWIKSGTLYDIWAESEGGNVVAVGAPGIAGTTFDQVMYSTDGGDSWDIGLFNQPTGQDLNDISMVDNLLGYACGDEGTIYKTTDGGATWDSVSTPSALELEEVFFLDALLGYTFGDDDEAYKTTDGGATWTPLTVGFGTADILAGYFTDANTGWVVGTSGLIYKTTDGGATWTPQTSGVTSFLRSIHMVTDNIGYICGSSSRAFKTTDGGATWTPLTVFSSSTTFYDIEFKDENNGIIVASSGRTFITGDGGTTWMFENNSSSTLYGVAIERTSIDTAATYTCGSLGFIMRNAHVIVPVELASFNATVTGNDVTLSWITATEVNNLGFKIERQSEDEWMELGFVDGHGTSTELNYYSYVDKNLAAGSYNYRIKQVDYDGSYKYYDLQNAVEVSAPETYSLAQNYPNPFNPTTTIEYSVPVDGFVTLAIYNVLGEKIADLVNTNVKAGSYEISFDAGAFASGMYIYRMEAGDFVSIKKMMILK